MILKYKQYNLSAFLYKAIKPLKTKIGGIFMSSITNTSISSYDYLLRNCYSSNRTARKSIYRSTLTQNELINADSNALKKISKNLRELEYDTDNGVSIYNNVKAFVESYNNLVGSSDNSASDKLVRTEKNLKNLVKNYSDELEEIGITISSSGELKIDKETLLSCSPSKIKKVFSSSSELSSGVIKYATSISRISKNLLQTGTSENKKTNNLSNDLLSLTEATNIMNSTSIDMKA